MLVRIQLLALVVGLMRVFLASREQMFWNSGYVRKSRTLNSPKLCNA